MKSSRQNKYFYGARLFELAELKMMVDAIQAARFITPGKSKKLIGKLSTLTDVHHAAELDRQLFLSGVAKAMNERILYIVNMIYEAISTRRQPRFKYYEYTAEKKVNPSLQQPRSLSAQPSSPECSRSAAKSKYHRQKALRTGISSN